MIEQGVSGVEVATLATAGTCIIGLFVTWIRNGRGQTKLMGEMEGRQNEQIKTVFNKLDDPNTGLGAIKKTVENQKTHCADVVGRFDERLKNLEEKKD